MLSWSSNSIAHIFHVKDDITKKIMFFFFGLGPSTPLISPVLLDFPQRHLWGLGTIRTLSKIVGSSPNLKTTFSECLPRYFEQVGNRFEKVAHSFP